MGISTSHYVQMFAKFLVIINKRWKYYNLINMNSYEVFVINKCKKTYFFALINVSNWNIPWKESSA